ncbi:TetR/AcrR family transcriptional regulator [Amycolatopsis pigmentata]|uniref:TetR/AcrR family transcriptional regulator n=1 Tax=Amycolatopsis pigmentata TaxID=450801 RepID=A0ABW5G0G0_9PSEU
MVKPAAVPGRPRSRDAAGLPAVTPEKIVVSALELTARHGLDSWTLRQLAAAVDAYPAVVYHHVGDREAVVAAVVERVIALVPVPDADLPWREWFRTLLTDLRRVLTDYPGVARRLALYGATSAPAATIVDHGVRTLQAAGFGDEAPKAYLMVINAACLILSMEDEQHRNAEIKERTGEALAKFRGETDRPGLAAMGAAMFELITEPGRRANFFADFYDYAVERCLDGLACRLGALR